jgi:hypothetical protein
VTGPIDDDDAARGEGILQQLTAGEAGPVLVADFQAFSSAPRLSQLVSDRAAGRPVYQVDPLDALSQGRPYKTLTGLAAAAGGSFARSAPASGRVVVIGYCSAAALSLRIAAMLAGSREVAVVLLRPSWPDTELIRNQFATLAANVGAAHRLCPELDGDPDSCVARMADILRADIEALAASHGLDGSSGTFLELLLTYRSWLAFLLACRNDAPPAWAGAAAVTVLTEAKGSVTIPGLRPGAFEVRPLPSLDEKNPVTAEVVELVVAQITGR